MQNKQTIEWVVEWVSGLQTDRHLEGMISSVLLAKALKKYHQCKERALKKGQSAGSFM